MESKLCFQWASLHCWALYNIIYKTIKCTRDRPGRRQRKGMTSQNGRNNPAGWMIGQPHYKKKEGWREKARNKCSVQWFMLSLLVYFARESFLRDNKLAFTWRQTLFPVFFHCVPINYMFCLGLFFCLITVPSLPSLLSSSLHPCFCLWVMSQGAARGPRYLHRYLASFPFLMGDMGAWQQTEVGAVGRGRDGWVGGGVDGARDRQIEKESGYKKKDWMMKCV